MIQKKYKIHFIGIGGIGMSGIAEIFLLQGHIVSGSDATASDVTERLVRLGAQVYIGHKEEQVHAVDVVVISSAVRPNNPEVVAAKRRGIPIIPRAEMLAEVMRGKIAISIAGTHGKTTTTAMTAQILIKAGLDPTVVVGGKVEAIGSNAKVGSGNYVVAEADESDGSFQFLPTTFSVVTNIDTDHMDYYKTAENLDDAFIRFTKKIPFFGCNWICGEDAGLKKIIPQMTKPFFTYGWSQECDLYADKVIVENGFQKFDVWHRKAKNQPHEFLGKIELSVLGKHNLLNALGAIGVSLSLGANFFAAKEALAEFRHVRRRFDERFYSAKRNIRIIDDYGHHPTEIKAVLETAKQAAAQYGHKRIITVFQPHRYSRTQLCWNEFLSCFDGANELFLLPIYAASEDPIPGVTSEALASQIRNTSVTVIPDLQMAAEMVSKSARDGDLILSLGAGSITKLPDQLKSLIS